MQLGLPRYFTGKPCKNGHIDERFVSDHGCVTCGNVRSRTRRAPGFKEKLAKQVEIRSSVAEENSRLSGIQLMTREEAIASGLSRYYTGILCPKGHNSERFVSGRICVKCTRERRLEPHCRAYYNTLSRVYQASEIYGRHLIGISIKGFKKYIESQFTGEMSWDNYGEIWELDHRKPLCAFDLTDQDDLKVCAHYTNIHPVTPSENKKKYQESDFRSARGLLKRKQQKLAV